MPKDNWPATPEEKLAREERVRGYLKRGLLIAEIARAEGVTRQSMWEWCARRKLLPDEEVMRYSENIADKDRRKRS